MYTIDLGFKIITCESFDSLTCSERQEVAEKAVSEHVYSNENTIIEYILNHCSEDYENVPFTYEDIVNYTPTDEVPIGNCWLELTESERDEKLEFYEYLRDKKQDYQDHLIHSVGDGSLDDRADEIQKSIDSLEDICDNLSHMDFNQYPEIYQWFSVSNRLYHWLSKHGYCVLDGSFYGRQSCGQSLILDCNIQRFAFEVLARKEVIQ